MNLQPITLKEANAFIEQHHRHHGSPAAQRAAGVQQIRRYKPLRGWYAGVAIAADNEVVGVAVAGRPSARHLQDGWTAEVTRCCVLPTAPRGACSKLYAALWRSLRAIGWRRLVTYTLPSEGGASLRGAGWRIVHETKAETWHREARPRVDQPLQRKLRWEKTA